MYTNKILLPLPVHKLQKQLVWHWKGKVKENSFEFIQGDKAITALVKCHKCTAYVAMVFKHLRWEKRIVRIVKAEYRSAFYLKRMDMFRWVVNTTTTKFSTLISIQVVHKEKLDQTTVKRSSLYCWILPLIPITFLLDYALNFVWRKLIFVTIGTKRVNN